MVFLTLGMIAMHTHAYSVNVEPPASLGGSVVGLAASILAATVAVAAFPTWPTGRWRALAAGTGLLALIFAILPSVTAGYGWLTLFLFALTTLGCEAVMVTWLVIARPWSWMNGAPD